MRCFLASAAAILTLGFAAPAAALTAPYSIGTYATTGGGSNPTTFGPTTSNTGLTCNSGDILVMSMDIALRSLTSITGNSTTWTASTVVNSGANGYIVAGVLGANFTAASTLSMTLGGNQGNTLVAFDCYPGATAFAAGGGASYSNQTHVTTTTGPLAHAGYVAAFTRFNTGGVAATVDSPGVLLTTDLQTLYGIKSYYLTTTTAGVTFGTTSVLTSGVQMWIALTAPVGTTVNPQLLTLGVGQ